MMRMKDIIGCMVIALLLIPAYAVAGDRALPRVAIESIPDGSPGSTQYVSITVEHTELEMGGFDFLMAYDESVLTFVQAWPGQLLVDCEWEYFTYRFGSEDCGEPWCSEVLRVVGVAETNNGSYHPSCYGPPDTDPHELGLLEFIVTSDMTVEGQYLPIRFFWDDCNDNAISSIDGQYLMIDRAIYDFEGNLVWNEDDDDLFPEDERIPYVGAPDSCTTPERFVCGDANSDGTINVGDAVMIINYVFNGGPAPIPIDGGDANGDGSCNVGDAVYLINYVFKGGPAPVCPPVIRLIDYQHGGIYILEH